MSKNGFAPIITVLIITLLVVGGIGGHRYFTNKSLRRVNKEITTTTEKTPTSTKGIESTTTTANIATTTTESKTKSFATTSTKTTQNPSIQTPALKKNKKTTGEENANWKTYKNEKYGFGIDYPSEFLVSNKENKENKETTSSYKQIIRIEPISKIYKDSKLKEGYLKIVVCKGDLKDCLMKVPENINPSGIYEPFWEDRINNTPFYYFESEEKNKFFVSYRTIYKGLLYGIRLNFVGKSDVDVKGEWYNVRYESGKYKHQEDNLLKDFNQTLSSFKFTEGTSSVSELSEVYRNKKYQFEFRYPQGSTLCDEKEVSTRDLGFRCDYDWNGLKGIPILKLRFSDYTFRPVAFERIKVPVDECATMYISKVDKKCPLSPKPDDWWIKGVESGERPDGWLMKKIKRGKLTFYYINLGGDCDMQGCNAGKIYYLPHNNECYEVLLNSFTDSGLSKADPTRNGKFLGVPSDWKRFENLFDQILSSFKFLQ